MDRETVLRLASEFTLVTKNMTEGVYVESLERFADACCAWQKEVDAKVCEAQRNQKPTHFKPEQVYFDPSNIMALKCAAAIRVG